MSILAGACGLGLAAEGMQWLRNPRVYPWALAGSVFATNLVSLQSNTKELADWLTQASSKWLCASADGLHMGVYMLHVELVQPSRGREKGCFDEHCQKKATAGWRASALM